MDNTILVPIEGSTLRGAITTYLAVLGYQHDPHSAAAGIRSGKTLWHLAEIAKTLNSAKTYAVPRWVASRLNLNGA